MFRHRPTVRAAWPIFALLLAFGFSITTHAADLTAEQQQQVEAAKSALRQMETSVDLAEQTAGGGSGALTGSKAKLTKIRLDGALPYVPKAEAALKDLPADHADVKPLVEAFDNLNARIAAIQARLNGGAAPPPAAEGGVRLNHLQEEDFRNARFYISEIKGLADGLTQLAQEASAVADKTKINYRVLNGGAASLAKIRERAGFINGYFEKLPADGRGVPELKLQYDQIMAQTEQAAATLAPIHKLVTDLVNPANYPDFEEDYKRLGGLVRLYYDPGTLTTQREAAIDALKQREPAYAELVRFAQKYQPLADQRTEQGERASSLVAHFVEKFKAYNAAAETQKTELPASIREDMTEAQKIADEAVAEQKPMWFTGGIPQRMGWVTEKMALYEVLDPEPAAALKKDVEALQTKINQQEKSLGQLIINNNQLPNDNYQGDDRDKVIAVAIDAWKHQQPQFDVLATRIPSQAWARNTRWEYSNGTWYFLDTSKLQVQLIVADQDNPKQAIIRPVNIIMNHEKGDTLIGTPFYSIDDDLQPNAYLLRDKIK